jgi:hypothetical protein
MLARTASTTERAFFARIRPENPFRSIHESHLNGKSKNPQQEEENEPLISSSVVMTAESKRDPPSIG